ncbi:MAG: ankyrin repeat domain-containing protein, partial [Kiritimatiellae bacterium]|nr:ankyrin repeat domain-containing protein [Kiritimatiellia bacterium]
CLVESGSNVNLTTYRNRDMLTPLGEAVLGANKNGSDFSVVRYLIDKGAKLDEETGKYSSNKSLKEYLQNIRNLKR